MNQSQSGLAKEAPSHNSADKIEKMSNPDTLGKYEHTIKDFLHRYYNDPVTRNHCGGFEGPKPGEEDKKIRVGDFYVISEFHTTHPGEGKTEFHFNIGNTKFNITGSAARRVVELMKD